MKLALGPALKLVALVGVLLVAGWFGYDYLKLRIERTALKTQAAQMRALGEQQSALLEAQRRENEKLDRARRAAARVEDYRTPMPESIRVWWNGVQHD